jgi:hypothetical protein
MSASMAVGYIVGALAVASVARALHGALIARRSRTWKLAVTVTGLGLGVGPALAGRVVGYVLVATGALASASLVAGLAEWARRHLAGRWRPQPGLDEPPVTAVRALTELDQAGVHLEKLRSQHVYLNGAASSDDVRAQLAAASDIATTARRLRDLLEVVARERDVIGRHR